MKFEDNKIPIVFGVTGHQDIRRESIPGILSTTKRIFEEIRSAYPSSPLLLLSPLAEGADRLVAEVALDLGIPFIAPLPLPLDDYRTDFSGSSLKEFESLLGQSQSYFVVPYVRANSELVSRETAYASIGAYIAEQCHILIALWDGQESNREGGTDSIVRFKLDGVPEPFRQPVKRFHQIESGPVYHVFTPRTSASQGSQQLDFSGYRRCYPNIQGIEANRQSRYAGILSNIDSYNLEIGRNKLRLHRLVNQSKLDLLDSEPLEIAVDMSTRKLIYCYATADALATLFKRRRVRSLQITLALIAFSVLGLQLDGFFNSIILGLMYPAFLGISMGVYFLARYNRYELKHEDYRALAEASRIQVFWRLCAIEENVADFYLYKHRGELEWIRYALRAWSIPKEAELSANPTASEDHASRLFEMQRFAVQHWISKQREWYSNRSAGDNERLIRWKKLANVLFIASLVIAISLLVARVFSISLRSTTGILHVILGMSLTISGLLHGYCEKLVLAEQSKQYQRMGSLFSAALLQLAGHSGPETSHIRQEIITELGKQTLSETGDWLFLHRGRPMELPKA